MGIFFVYILKSSVCLAVFYLFYRLFEGALITTFLAPASKCACAFSIVVNTPEHSNTYSTPNSPHGTL